MSREAQIAIHCGAQDLGLATMLSDLIRQNLNRQSRKRVDFDKLDTAISIVVTDADVSAVLVFARGSLDIRSGSDDPPQLRIAATAETILALCTVRIHRGVPRVFDRMGFRILKSLVTGELRLGGALRHPLQLVYFTRLMSVNE